MHNNVTLNMNTPSVQYLCNKDKRLAKVISMVGSIEYEIHSDSYSFLVHEIIEQMLSVKAGTKIFSRLENLCEGNITPESIGSLSDEEIKSIGTSHLKVTYIRNLTDAVLNGNLIFSELADLPDTDIYKKLLHIKGIGNWTAKMYLIFVLNRQDILPYEDAAFLQTYQWMYKTNRTNMSAVIKRCNKWKPYSSIAARFMYRALDLGLTKNTFHLHKDKED